MFWDNVEISVAAGSGGDGLISFRRERGEAMGGPDGGDGGDGGSVVLRAEPNLNTLAEFARRKRFTAESGKPGGKARKHGKSASDLVLNVPIGTIVYDQDKVIADLARTGQEMVIAKGGRGGFGNAHFTSSVRQTPRHAELGEPGERREMRLELKLVADVGLVGLPSVGKSTLLSRLTKAKPKIAEYPFTTTIPQLGVARVSSQTLVLADIPGLIAGAHQGKGLGDAFLRHIERTKVIVHLLDATREDPVVDYQQIRRELVSFSGSLVHKPELVAINKSDTLDPAAKNNLSQDLSQRLGRKVWFISAVSGEGLTGLLREAGKLVDAQPVQLPDPESIPVFTLADLAPRAVTVTKTGKHFTVAGVKIERLAKQTDFTNPGAAERFWWLMRRLGATKQLEKLGAAPGSSIKVAGQALTWEG